MTLAPPSNRHLAHTRTTQFLGYRRDDGLWDIEAELKDTKPFALALSNERELPPGQAVHNMHIRVTINQDLVIQDIQTAMIGYPHETCAAADANMKKMIGSTMGKGWRKSIETHLGHIQGCTHMRELLYNMATAAFQTLAPEMLKKFSEVDASNPLPPPPHLGACHTWDFNGPTVEKIYPIYFQWPKRVPPNPPSASKS